MADFNKHDASGQLIGYFYQILTALLLLLETKEPKSKICIEKFDDVSFVKDNVPQIMVQTKHHITKQGTLTDTSIDLWRTINSWCDSIKRNLVSTKDTKFIIITTAEAKDNTAAFYLNKSNYRKPDKALAILRDIAKFNFVHTNQPFYKMFMSLDEDEQENLVNHFFICDSAPHIRDVKISIMPYLRPATFPQFEEKVYDKLVGWWINNVIECLDSVEPVFISYGQLRNQMNDIGNEYKADSLPIDVDPQYQPTEDELEQLSPKNRLFIEQLRLIALKDERIKRCVRDYYNAYQQRSQWVRESLLYIDDLTKYENILVDEWNRLFLIMKEELDECGDRVTADQKCTKGRDLFNEIEKLERPIRKNVSEPFIMRGTFHGLANQKRVGWHVDFMDRLCHLLIGEEI